MPCFQCHCCKGLMTDSVVPLKRLQTHRPKQNKVYSFSWFPSHLSLSHKNQRHGSVQQNWTASFQMRRDHSKLSELLKGNFTSCSFVLNYVWYSPQKKKKKKKLRVVLILLSQLEPKQKANENPKTWLVSILIGLSFLFFSLLCFAFS